MALEVTRRWQAFQQLHRAHLAHERLDHEIRAKPRVSDILDLVLQGVPHDLLLGHGHGEGHGEVGRRKKNGALSGPRPLKKI